VSPLEALEMLERLWLAAIVLGAMAGIVLAFGIFLALADHFSNAEAIIGGRDCGLHQ
jgi:hypothetical protein